MFVGKHYNELFNVAIFTIIFKVLVIPKYAASELPSSSDIWQCEKYRGSACSEVLGDHSIYLENGQTQEEIEAKISEAFLVLQDSPDLTTHCAKYAAKVICLHSFVPCTTKDGLRLKRLCRDECELLEADICHVEYTISKKHPLFKNQNILPVCSQLPSISSPLHDECARLGIVAFGDFSDELCYNGDGKDYRGTVSRSSSNLQCLPWSNGNLFKWIEYGELRGGHNYCRNPGSKENKPWCFVNNHTNPIQFCKIPACVDFTYFWLYILVPVMAAALIFSLVVCIWCMLYRVNKKRVRHVKEENKALEIKEEFSDVRKEKLSAINALEVPLSHVKFSQELGEGAFGKVFKGQVVGLLHERTVTPVAIKTLKLNASLKTRQEFRREVELMAYLQHPNIICLLGVCINDQPMCMLFEFMSCGDLHEYLVSNFMPIDGLNINDYGEYPSECGSISSSTLTLKDLLYISSQIAAGMEYLSSHHYVHRDLATRNCLVGDNQSVKISDFGLSRDIYSSDYYRVQSKSLLPVRWMPPESILYGRFTSESDIWSFGVVLWEIFNYGQQPYYGRSNQEVVDMIRSRQLLPCPPNCPPQVYGLMLQTWHGLPSQRPSFRAIYDDLRLWLKVFSSVDNLNLSCYAHSSVGGGSRSSTMNRQSRRQATHRTSVGDLYMPWKPRPQLTPVPRSPQTYPEFIDERFEPKITVV